MNTMHLYDTREKKLNFIRTRGNIITFKEPSSPRGATQIIVDEFVDEEESGEVKIEGPWCGTPWHRNVDELLDAIDWEWMEAAHTWCLHGSA